MISRLVVLLLIGLCVACAPLSRQSSVPTGDFDVIELSIDQAHDALRTGRISCEQLTRRYLQRIDAYDPPRDAIPNPPAMSSPAPAGELNAITAIHPNALARARQLDRQYAETGRMRTLHCIPVILKDNSQQVSHRLWR